MGLEDSWPCLVQNLDQRIQSSRRVEKMSAHGWAETHKASKAEVKEELTALGFQFNLSSQGRGIPGTSHLRKYTDCQKPALNSKIPQYKISLTSCMFYYGTYTVVYVILAQEQ